MDALLPDRWLNELPVTTGDGIRLMRGSGAVVWDDEDRRYLDLTSGGGSALLGHGHPAIRAALFAQAGQLTGIPAGYEHDTRDEFLEALSLLVPEPLSHVCITGSGSEAIDIAIGCAAELSSRPRLVAIDGSSHGWSLNGRGLEVVRVPFDDLDALETAVDGLTAAVIVEPIQVDAGIRVPTPGYLAGVVAICRARGALLIIDEVQTALRDGPVVASVAAGVVPDLMCLGSSLANGLPIGVVAIDPRLARRIRIPWRDPGTAGNPIICAAATATLIAVRDATLQTQARLAAERLLGRLRSLRLSEIHEVRGRGMLIALDTRLGAAAMVRGLEAQGILVLPGRGGTIRLLPPLILDRQQADATVEAVAAAILGGRRPRRRAATQDAEVELTGVRDGQPAGHPRIS